jgi:putative membrane protein
MLGFVVRGLIAALGLWLATEWVGGVRLDTATTLILAGLLLGIVNAVVRPVILILTLPLTFLTLGFFLLVINAAMLGLVALLLSGFQISGFWTAVGASLIVSLTGWVAAGLIGNNGKVEVMRSR